MTPSINYNDYESASYAYEPPQQKICFSCYRPMHPKVQGPHCAQHELQGYLDELARDPWNAEIQAGVAQWRIICEEEGR